MTTKRFFGPLLAILFLAGCATTSDPQSGWENRLERAGSAAAYFHLRDNEQDVAKFTEIRAKLAALHSDANATPTNIVQIIESIPLKGEAFAYRELALGVIGEVQGPSVNLDIGGVHRLVVSLDRGIGRGMAQAAAERLTIAEKVTKVKARK